MKNQKEMKNNRVLEVKGMKDVVLWTLQRRQWGRNTTVWCDRTDRPMGIAAIA